MQNNFVVGDSQIRNCIFLTVQSERSCITRVFYLHTHVSANEIIRKSVTCNVCDESGGSRFHKNTCQLVSFPRWQPRIPRACNLWAHMNPQCLSEEGETNLLCCSPPSSLGGTKITQNILAQVLPHSNNRYTTYNSRLCYSLPSRKDRAPSACRTRLSKRNV